MVNDKNLKDILVQLKKESRFMTILGLTSVLLTGLATYLFFRFMVKMTDDLFKKIETMHDKLLKINNTHNFDDLSALLFYLAIRSLIFWIIGSMIIYSLIKFAKACFDQSARYTKRLHSTEFLEYITTNEKDENLDKKMLAFYVWNLTVESAFSNIGETKKGDNKFLDKLFSVEAKKNEVTSKIEFVESEEWNGIQHWFCVSVVFVPGWTFYILLAFVLNLNFGAFYSTPNAKPKNVKANRCHSPEFTK